MLRAGRIQKLTVSRISDYGLYLADEEQNEVLLPNRYISLTDKPGDEKEVFLYHDSEDRLVATTETPLLRVGEAGYLRVVDKTAHGAFLDWGLYGKDLFLPNRNQQGGIIAGRSYIVYLYEDSVTGRCVATCKLKSFINNDSITVAPRQEVDLPVASESPIGYRVIINNRHWGMLYRNQLFRPIAVGDQRIMAKITTAERVSREASDNFVFQRSLLAYHAAAQRISGDVLEIGTGAGYGIEVVAPRARSFVTIDKLAPAPEPTQLPNVEFRQATVPPLPFANDSFDFVISFQVIEHIKQDIELVREVKRVLRPGGKFIVTTPNAPMSLTRNPWHIREYTAVELRSLLGSEFSSVEALGVSGNARVMEYYEQNRRSVERITRFDILDLQHRLPRCLLQFPYDVLNRINRRRLLKSNTDLTTSIRMDDYRIGPVTDESFDLFFVAEK